MSGLREWQLRRGRRWQRVTAALRRRRDVEFVTRAESFIDRTIGSLFEIAFPELTYAAPGDPWYRRWVIRAVEHLAGRSYFVEPYRRWKADHIANGSRVVAPMLPLVDIEMRISQGRWPPQLDDGAPLVIVANHPYGVLDGIAALTLAEDLGRPFKVLIHKDLMKVPEIRPYCLPIDFSETKAALTDNIRTRNEALQLIKDGTTIVVFPAGGVATAPDIWGPAVDLPWKSFTARMILAARAQVLPLYFEGQCSPFFQFVSRYSPTLRLSLIISEFRRRVGSRLDVRVGEVITFEEIKATAGSDRKVLMTLLYDRVHALSGMPLEEIRARAAKLPAWLKS